MHDSAEAVVERQLQAYNRKDVEQWLATYAEDASQYRLTGELIAQGHKQLRRNIEARFQEPDLHAHLINRLVFDSIVIDHERLTRNFPEGRGSVEVLCIYQVKDGLIQTAQFQLHNQQLDNPGER